MAKNRTKNFQTAQGMLEFALVLPLLLLLIFGIFAFGHLFFVYSSVVSASREAARWGAAVGEAGPDAQRYQDCNAIRKRAVDLGTFAGVNDKELDLTNPNSTGIQVYFDHGPDPVTGASEKYADCPADGVGPADVQGGDRVFVRVRVIYNPIVPLVNIPSFPLEATSFRTILRSVKVAQNPTAEDPCTTDTTITLDDNFTSDHVSKVGEYVIYSVEVKAVPVTDPACEDQIPSGYITINNDDGSVLCEGALAEAMNGKFSCEAPGFQYMSPGVKTIKARFDSDKPTVHYPSNTSAPGPDFTHTVVRASSIITYKVFPSSGALVNQSLTIEATVTGDPPISLTPTGSVTITMQGQGPRTVPLDPNGVGSALFVPTSPGTYEVTIDYPDGDVNFTAAPQVRFNVTIGMITPTPTITPTSTPNPVMCPSLTSSINFGAQQDGFLLGVRNNDGSNSISITSVSLNWPDLPTAKLQEIHFAGSTGTGCGGNSNCLWNSGSGLNPASVTVANGDQSWDNSLAQLAANDTKQMRIVFNHNLPNGAYHLVVNFSNGCVLDVKADRLITR